LEEHGYDDVVTLTTCAEAVAWLEDNAPSMAIVDPHLSDGLCSVVVRHLARAQVPLSYIRANPDH
jgi:ActR/RegA family two-component response regulator